MRLANHTKQYDKAVELLETGGTHTRIAESLGIGVNVVQRWSWIHAMGATVEKEFKRRGALPDALIRVLAKAQTNDVVEFGRLWTAFMDGTWKPSEPLAYVCQVYAPKRSRAKRTVGNVVVIALNTVEAERIVKSAIPPKWTVKILQEFDAGETGVVYTDVE